MLSVRSYMRRQTHCTYTKMAACNCSWDSTLKTKLFNIRREYIGKTNTKKSCNDNKGSQKTVTLT